MASENNMKMKSIIFCLAIIISLFSPQETYCQKSTDLTDDLVHYLGLYVFNTPRCNPPNFEKIRWIRINKFPNQDIDNPKTDAKGFVQIDGYIETIDDERFKFKKATLKKDGEGNFEEFEFETEKIKGINFTFKGKFLDKSINHGGIYTDMFGTLTKFKNGEWFASVETSPFSKYANM